MAGMTPALSTANVVLRLLRVLNGLSGVAILALLVATLVATPWTFAALGIADDSDIARLIVPLRWIAALGVLAVVLSDVVLRRLLAIVRTVGGGEPFAADNALRLESIAWALLALQLLSIVIASIGKAVSTPEFPLHLDAGFSINGWLAVLMTFILARVFADGARMREELDGTV